MNSNGISKDSDTSQEKKDENRTDPSKGNQDHQKLHIFINGIKYDESEGVKRSMTGSELAGLVPIPAENADITRKNSDDKIPIGEILEIHMADHFEIIRKTVEAG